uniref:Uncharacterized protein n=1 Tax=Corvus moneduloides TaxID=1196302 RepID=A0A8U7NG45_CORMO
LRHRMIRLGPLFPHSLPMRLPHSGPLASAMGDAGGQALAGHRAVPPPHFRARTRHPCMGAATHSGSAWGRLVADGVCVVAKQCRVTSSLRHLAGLPDSRVPPPRSSASWQSHSTSEECFCPCHWAELTPNTFSLLPCR